MTELTDLIAERGKLKAKVTKFQTYIDKVTGTTSRTEIKIRLRRFEPILQEFELIQKQIEAKDAGGIDKHVKYSDEFEDAYFQLVAKVEDLIAPQNAQSVGSTSQSSTNNSEIQVKLPVIELPSFLGEYDQWTSFAETFDSLINKNDKLSNVQKMHYLRSCLKKDAAFAIESLAVSDANFTIAWNLLKDRFENKRLIVKTHVNALFNLPQVNKDCPKSLRSLYDNVKMRLELLANQNLPTQHWDTLINHLVTSKFDFLTMREWESKLNSELPTFADLNKFINERCQLLESLQQNKTTQILSSHAKIVKNHAHQGGKIAHVVTTPRQKCPMCKQSHYINQCNTFLNLEPNLRRQEIQKLKLCLNCFKSNHNSNQCFSKYSCKTCKQRHHSLLHVNENNSQNQPSNSNPETNDNASCNLIAVTSQILLSTAVVHICKNNGQVKEARVLLDVGAQSNFISKAACRNLELKTKAVSIPISGINKSESKVNQMTTVSFKSRYNNYTRVVECLVLDKITDDLPTTSFNPSLLEIPKDLHLADDKFYISGPIDLLLGAQVFWELLCEGQLKLGKNQPHLQRTLLGWVVGGTIANPGHNNKIINSKALHSVQVCGLERQVRKFWEVEDYLEQNKAAMLSPEEIQCETHFVNTHERDNEGRFVTRLPFKSNADNLGDSFQIAKRRFVNLERQWQKKIEQKEPYVKFINEYVQLNHMEEISNDGTESSGSYYLPHHAVINPSSTTTQLRVVFDASAKTDTGLSLNDLLAIGPAIQQDLVTILMRFRTHQIAVAADISKMYRQIWIHPDHRKFQRILWREQSNQPLKTYQLKTVTYGTASAPFTAIRCLNKLAEDERETAPLAYRVITQDFYVDDVLFGDRDFHSVSKVRNELIKTLSKGGFELHKWASNDPRIITGKGADHIDFIFDENTETKTLGLIWDFKTDSFKYKLKAIPESKQITKRLILSTIAQLFDPLGLIGPILIKAKVILQKLWSLRLDWDEMVPQHVCSEFNTFLNQLSEVGNLKIPRKLISKYDANQRFEIHTFCDASELAYGACIYLRTADSNQKSVELITAKSRVTPLKVISLPRLELCGAVLAARLTQRVISALNLDLSGIFYWTDSTIVLSWLSAPPKTWKTFVANRVSEIQTISNEATWYHIESKQNPADLISRGVTPEVLKTSSRWWNGPDFLKLTSDKWPITKQAAHIHVNVPEKRTVNLSATITKHEICKLFVKYSCYSKLIRIIAYVLKFITMKCYKLKETGPLNSIQLNLAETIVIRLVQMENFPQDIHLLKAGKPVSRKSQLASLNVFLDSKQLIRVGGRLINADLSYDNKHPVVLPARNHVTNMIIRREHERLLHAGAQTTLASLRQKYWPIAGRQQVKNAIFRCIKCFRANPRTSHPLMGNLPIKRVEPARAFINCAVDYAGPISLRTSRGRGCKTTKAYIALFVCMATKAIHVELVGDLTTDAFLNALRRFMSRRGIVSNIYSDNASNFVGAERELKTLAHLCRKTFPSEIISELNQRGITWHFIPARSPHFGGLWEAGVKSVKGHLKKVVGNTLLTYEEMYTFLTRIEAVVNSRPLTPVSTDPTDLTCLTPGHFLIGEPLTAPLEPEMLGLQLNRLSRWQHIEYMRQHFWKRWYKEYLNNLQQRPKWQRQPQDQELTVGNMVVLRDDNLPPMQWRIGRITKVHPGPEGIIRVVSVRTSTGETKRAVKQVCALPIDN